MKTSRLSIRTGTALVRVANAALGRADLQLARRSALDGISWNDEPVASRATEGGDALGDRAAELELRYRGHPAAAHSLWSPERLRRELDTSAFRGDNAYLWQSRDRNVPIRYALTKLYVELHDEIGALRVLDEDGDFGAQLVEVDDRLVSRDLLDSALELNVLAHLVGVGDLRSILDIGAGYGRPAHRATTVWPDVRYVATDAVPISTAICETYLRHRRSPALIAPLDEVEAEVLARPPDLAVNIHSFSETTLQSIRWWIELLKRADVPRLFIVPSGGTSSQEADGSRIDYLPVLADAGYRCIDRRPKYANSASAQRFGVFPAEHLLFQLER